MNYGTSMQWHPDQWGSWQETDGTRRGINQRKWIMGFFIVMWLELKEPTRGWWSTQDSPCRKLLLPLRRQSRRQKGVPGRERLAIHQERCCGGHSGSRSPSKGRRRVRNALTSLSTRPPIPQCLLSADSNRKPEGKEAEMMPFFKVRHQHRGHKVGSDQWRQENKYKVWCTSQTEWGTAVCPDRGKTSSLY